MKFLYLLFSSLIGSIKRYSGYARNAIIDIMPNSLTFKWIDIIERDIANISNNIFKINTIILTLLIGIKQRYMMIKIKNR